MCCCCWRGVPWDAPAVTGQKPVVRANVATYQRKFSHLDESGHLHHSQRDNTRWLGSAADVYAAEMPDYDSDKDPVIEHSDSYVVDRLFLRMAGEGRNSPHTRLLLCFVTGSRPARTSQHLSVHRLLVCRRILGSRYQLTVSRA